MRWSSSASLPTRRSWSATGNTTLSAQKSAALSASAFASATRSRASLEREGAGVRRRKRRRSVRISDEIEKAVAPDDQAVAGAKFFYSAFKIALQNGQCGIFQVLI